MSICSLSASSRVKGGCSWRTVDYSTIGQDVGKSAALSKLAAAL